ncbi:MAG: DNA-binding NtrC family response regulator [Candidatus Promineifilaceae bacterium]|jgi:DNA-binding NtrC family response regulator
MSKSKIPTNPVLIVDDDEDLQRSFAFTLKKHGINNILLCSDSRNVLDMLAEQAVDIILLDLNMPNMSGRELLPLIVQRYPDIPVIVVTGVDEVNTAVKCMQAGAFDYMVKPVEEGTLLAAARRSLEVRDVKRENSLLREHLLSGELRCPEAFASIVTADKTMNALFQYIEAVSTTPQPILINGDTGVGKELVARSIHDVSGRTGRYVPVNIAGLDDNVFSDTLFGHLRGAFTGADKKRDGLIEQASGGTLFLDEIGDLNSLSQVKLLRLLQEREYFPLGSDTPRRTDARIIVATNRDLHKMQKDGTFREDLYYRLRSHLIRVPPLRERMEDLPLLVDFFLSKASESLGKKKPTPPATLFQLLATYPFPGNIRELEAMVFNAVSTHSGGMLDTTPFRRMIEESSREMDLEPLPVAAPEEDDSGNNNISDPMRPLPSLREAEGLLIIEALKRTSGNQTLAAQMLGVTRQTLNRHLKKKKSEDTKDETAAQAD